MTLFSSDAADEAEELAEVVEVFEVFNKFSPVLLWWPLCRLPGESDDWGSAPVVPWPCGSDAICDVTGDSAEDVTLGDGDNDDVTDGAGESAGEDKAEVEADWSVTVEAVGFFCFGL